MPAKGRGFIRAEKSMPPRAALGTGRVRGESKELVIGDLRIVIERSKERKTFRSGGSLCIFSPSNLRTAKSLEHRLCAILSEVAQSRAYRDDFSMGRPSPPSSASNSIRGPESL